MIQIATTLVVTATATLASAQPSPDPDPPPVDPYARAPKPPSTPPAAPSSSEASPAAASAVPAARPTALPDEVAPPSVPARALAAPRQYVAQVDMPTLISAPTGWLLPAGIIYSRTGLDTGGGVSSDQRVGLGDVAEFGVSTLDQVRACNGSGSNSCAATTGGTSAAAIQPYVAATFRMGVGENRLFAGQPGLVLGFRKSFDVDDSGYTTRIAELSLVASKKLGSRVAVHIGGAFWDASLQSDANSAVQTELHDQTIHTPLDQIRPFGGLQARPFDRASIMMDVSYAPEFCYECTAAKEQIRLRPELAWGVRYEVNDWMLLESGVRVPDIWSANLLGAQIFGKVTFIYRGLRHAIYGR
jgi:hypothetical protein